MDKSTLEFYLIGDAHPDALGLLYGFSFQRGKAGHGGFGGKDLLQFGTDLRVRRSEDGAAVLVGQDAGASQPCFLAITFAMRIMLRRISTVNSTSGALSRMYSWGFV